MSKAATITASHLERTACVYIRQSTTSQVERNRESTLRQYALKQRAIDLGWHQQRIEVNDEDLAHSGSEGSNRSGFVRLNGEVAMGKIGLILSIESSRVARNNSDWYRLLDLCSLTDTLIGDEDGLYHPAQFNDRLLLGLKGTMAEAELHVLRARLNGGIRNKAERGQLRRGLPIGFVWGEEDGEIFINPDQSVTGAIRTVFQKFADLGSARRVWLWLRTEGLTIPQQRGKPTSIRWVTPTYHAIHQILTNPTYAGAYTYGKSRTERCVSEAGIVGKRIKRLPRGEWAVLIHDHHEGYIDWKTYEGNLLQLKSNTHPKPHQPGGAIREGAALLQGIAVCGRCGRKLRTYYQGKNSTPGYYCSNNTLVNGRGLHCLRIGGMCIDKAISKVFLEVIEPAGVEAALGAEERILSTHHASLRHWRMQVEAARYAAHRAQKRYEAVDPENRLVARSLEARWEENLNSLSAAEDELKRRENDVPSMLTDNQRSRIHTLGTDLQLVWGATSTTDCDRKALLRTLIEEVIINPREKHDHVNLSVRWRTGAITDIQVALPARHQPSIRTDENTLDLIRRLAKHYNDDVIAGILNRQKRKTAHGLPFDTNRVGNTRRHWGIPKYVQSSDDSGGEVLNLEQAAQKLGTAPSTLYRWLNDGFIKGEQITPGAPWRIRMSDELKALFVEDAPEGYVTMLQATRMLGVSRQTVLHRVKRGELSALHVSNGKRKGLRIKVLEQTPDLFQNLS